MRYLLLALFLFILSVGTVVRAETSEDPDSGTSRAVEMLKSKLATKASEIRKDTQDRIATLTASALRKSAAIGTINSVDKKSVAIKTKSGNKTIAITSATTILSGRTTKQVSDLKPNQKVAIVISDESGLAAAQRIYLIPEKADKDIITVFGTVTYAGPKTITVQNPKTKTLVDLTLDAKTLITIKGGTQATATDITTGSKIIAIVQTGDDNETQIALRIHITKVKESTKASPKPSAGTEAASVSVVVKIAQQKLAGYLNVPASRIKVISQEETTWGDTSLGVKEAGGAYAQVITPGFKFVFGLDDERYEIHTDGSGKSLVLVEPLKRF